LGAFLDLREILFRASWFVRSKIGIGNEIASASAFPSATWERGKFGAALYLIIACLSLGVPLAAADLPAPALQSVTFRGQGFLVRTVDPQKEDLQLFLKDDNGAFLHDFVGLEKYLASKGERLVFAANAGMFEPDSKPVGLLTQAGNEVSPLNLNEGTGNFYMKPNGINEKHEAHVVESSEYSALLSLAIWATQSGPLLVHGGNINPDFDAESKSRKIRSGVGVRKDGTIVFALSKVPANFYDFAALFQTHFKCANALYLDGDISAFYVPGTKDTVPHSFGPMIGVVEKAK